MIRKAERPLTGPVGPVPEIKLGRRPGEPGATEHRWTYHGTEDGGWDRTLVEVPAEHRGQPAVTVNGGPGRSGARVFEDPAELTKFARELEEAARWLAREQMFGPQAEPPQDDELPGMWSAADFTGGLDEVRP